MPIKELCHCMAGEHLQLTQEAAMSFTFRGGLLQPNVSYSSFLGLLTAT